MRPVGHFLLKGVNMEEFKRFAIDTAYRCGWTFTQALLSCMTFGQSIMEIDWKQSIFISLGALCFVLLKQIGKWCLDHIKDPEGLQDALTDVKNKENEDETRNI